MNMSDTEPTKITLTIKNADGSVTEFFLTESTARELRDKLNSLFGPHVVIQKEIQPVPWYPVSPIPETVPVPWQPYWGPQGPTITCNNQLKG